VQVPFLLEASSISQGVPLLAAARGRVRGVRAWVLAWCAANFLETCTMFVLNQRDIHNLWVPYVFQPVEGALALWAFSCWQVSDVARRAMRLAIPPFVLVLWVLSVSLDSIASFSRWMEPLTALVSLFAAAVTLVARSRTSTGDVLRQDWFWVSAGMALYLGTFSMIGPLSALLAGNIPLLLGAFKVHAALTILAFLAIAWGLWCPARTGEVATARVGVS